MAMQSSISVTDILTRRFSNSGVNPLEQTPALENRLLPECYTTSVHPVEHTPALALHHRC